MLLTAFLKFLGKIRTCNVRLGATKLPNGSLYRGLNVLDHPFHICGLAYKRMEAARTYYVAEDS